MPDAAGGIVGGLIGADATKSASRAQQQAAEEANALQKEIYERNTKNFKPYLQAGNAGLNALMYRLGLGGTANGMAAPTVQTEAQIRESLLPRYTTQEAGKPEWEIVSPGSGESTGDFFQQTQPQQEVVDEAGLGAAIQAELAKQQAAYAEWEKGAQSDPMYGWLLDRFSMDDFEADPGYQFRLEQGNKALQNAAAATGNLNSGRALKDAIGYNSGMASQEYGNAYNRFTNDQNSQFNKLAAITGIGQSSASALAGVGQNYANQVGNNLIGAGNAQAAGIVGGANAINQGIGQVGNALQGYLANKQSGYSVSPYFTGGGNALNGWPT